VILLGFLCAIFRVGLLGFSAPILHNGFRACEPCQGVVGFLVGQGWLGGSVATGGASPMLTVVQVWTIRERNNGAFITPFYVFNSIDWLQTMINYIRALNSSTVNPDSRMIARKVPLATSLWLGITIRRYGSLFSRKIMWLPRWRSNS
jgi:hypothetical protein